METTEIVGDQAHVIATDEMREATDTVAPTSDYLGDAVLQNLISRIGQQEGLDRR